MQGPTTMTLTCELLGGPRQFKRRPANRADIHDVLVAGLPNAALVHLLDRMAPGSEDAVAGVVGVSTRTLRRSKAEPQKMMAPDIASKTWLLAETLARATAVFGSQPAAEQWLFEPAMGLGGARPIDLLRTLQGAELVSDHLGRLEHGVYV